MMTSINLQPIYKLGESRPMGYLSGVTQLSDVIGSDGDVMPTGATGSISGAIGYARLDANTVSTLTQDLQFSVGPGRPALKIDMSTFEVTLPEGMSLSEVSQAFWDAVIQQSGQVRANQEQLKRMQTQWEQEKAKLQRDYEEGRECTRRHLKGVIEEADLKEQELKDQIEDLKTKIGWLEHKRQFNYSYE